MAGKNVNGKLRFLFVEVKSNTSRLSKDQKKGAAYFVRDRLGRATNSKHPKYWKSLDEETRTLARFVKKNIKGQSITGVVAKVKIEGTDVIDVVFKEW